MGEDGEITDTLVAGTAPNTTAGAIIWTVLLQTKALRVSEARIYDGPARLKPMLMPGSVPDVSRFPNWVWTHTVNSLVSREPICV